MALNKLLACASSARAAEMLAVPAIAAMARTNTHVVALLVNFVPARRMPASTVA